MNIKKILLEDGEFYKEETKKTTIYLHHTAGGHRPDFVLNGWEVDKIKNGGQLTVATSYLIGGPSTSDANGDWDGVIINCFDDKYWAHHLGLKAINNTQLNKQSIGIEICNYGYVVKGKDGKFYNYVNKTVPDNMVCELSEPFRGFKFYHKYSDKQIQSLKDLILDIAKRHDIDVNRGLCESFNFEVDNNALVGKTGGIYSHSNVRKDKFDVSPQPNLINMLKSLKTI